MSSGERTRVYGLVTQLKVSPCLYLHRTCHCIMPSRKNKTLKRLRKLVNAGFGVGNAIKDMSRSGFNERNVGDLLTNGYRGGATVANLVKRRKGGVQTHGNYVQWVNNGLPPYRKFNGRVAKNSAKYRRIMANANVTVPPRRVRNRKSRRPIGAAVNAAFKSARGNSNTTSSTNVDTRVSNTESVTAVYGNGPNNPPTVWFYKVNFGQSALFKWGASVALNWMYYNVAVLWFRYMSVCPSTETGRVALAMDYNPLQDPTVYSTLDELARLHSVQGDVKDHLMIVFNPSKMTNPVTKLLIRGGTLPNTNDPMQYDLTHIYVGVEDTSENLIGRFIVGYTMLLSDPQPITVTIASNATSQGTIDPPALMANMLEHSNSSPIVYAPDGDTSLIQFNQEISGILTILSLGTGFGAGYADTDSASPIVVNALPSSTNIDVYESAFAGNTVQQTATWYIEASEGAFLQVTANNEHFETFSTIQVIFTESNVPIFQTGGLGKTTPSTHRPITRVSNRGKIYELPKRGKHHEYISKTGPIQSIECELDDIPEEDDQIIDGVQPSHPMLSSALGFSDSGRAVKPIVSGRKPKQPGGLRGGSLASLVQLTREKPNNDENAQQGRNCDDDAMIKHELNRMGHHPTTSTYSSAGSKSLAGLTRGVKGLQLSPCFVMTLITMSLAQIYRPSMTTTTTMQPTTLRPTPSPTSPTQSPSFTPICIHAYSSGVGQNNSTPMGKAPVDDCSGILGNVGTQSGLTFLAINIPGDYLFVTRLFGTTPLLTGTGLVIASGTAAEPIIAFQSSEATETIAIIQLFDLITPTVYNYASITGVVSTSTTLNVLYVGQLVGDTNSRNESWKTYLTILD